MGRASSWFPFTTSQDWVPRVSLELPGTRNLRRALRLGRGGVLDVEAHVSVVELVHVNDRARPVVEYRAFELPDDVLPTPGERPKVQAHGAIIQVLRRDVPVTGREASVDKWHLVQDRASVG